MKSKKTRKWKAKSLKTKISDLGLPEAKDRSEEDLEKHVKAQASSHKINKF